jgi:nucleoside-diphosphate-sugar epimerase
VATLLLTGGTGRVGRRLIGPLRRAGFDTTLLVRPRGAEGAGARAARAAGGPIPHVDAELGGRMGAVRRGQWDVVVHAGLDGAFFPRDPFVQRRHNVDGSLVLLDAAEPRRFVLLSTVHVAGARTGSILESEHDVGQALRNPGEECMLEAEAALREHAARRGTELVILRLGPVDGCGLDGPPDGLTAFAQLVAAAAWNHRYHRSQLRTSGLRAAPMAISPGRWVGEAAAALVKSPAAAGRTLHLLAHPPTQEAFFAAVADRAGFPGLRIQAPRRGAVRQPTRLEARAHAAIAHQLDYLCFDQHFDCSGAHALLTEAGVPIADLRGPDLVPYVDSLIEA